MKTIVHRLFNFFMGFIACLFLITQFSFEQNKNKQIADPQKQETYQWYSPSVPDKMDFAGEAVPLTSWDVRERFDRELLFNYYWQNNILFILKMANRYFPIIEERLKVNGVPADFKYLCIAESNLLANATSKAGAVGFWQFMAGTAPAYELEVNNQVDERKHIIQSTDAACKYLKAAYQKFGTWTAAAAAYNCGQGGYSKQANIQKTMNYYNLLLPEETNRYIFRILALKHFIVNANDLGFILKNDELYHPIQTKVITVTESITDLAQFAIDNGTNYKILRLLNPWLKANVLTVRSGKKYEILLPKNRTGSH